MYLTICLVTGGVFFPKTGQADAFVCSSLVRAECLGPWLARKTITYFMGEMPVFKASFFKGYNSKSRLLDALGRGVFLSFYEFVYRFRGTKLDCLVEMKEYILLFLMDQLGWYGLDDVQTNPEVMNLFLLAYYIDGLERAAEKAGAGENLAQALMVYDDSARLFQLLNAVNKTLKKNALKLYGPQLNVMMTKYFDDLVSAVETGLPRGTKTKARESFSPDKAGDIKRYIMTLLEWSKIGGQGSQYVTCKTLGSVLSYEQPQTDGSVWSVKYLLDGMSPVEPLNFYYQGHYVFYNTDTKNTAHVDVNGFRVSLRPGQMIIVGFGGSRWLNMEYSSVKDGEVGWDGWPEILPGVQDIMTAA